MVFEVGWKTMSAWVPWSLTLPVRWIDESGGRSFRTVWMKSESLRIWGRGLLGRLVHELWALEIFLEMDWR